MAWLKPEDEQGVAYEFFSPFAHVEGRYEWCRIRSPTHGVFDVFILLGATTGEPATVYVSSDAGARFMADRYPECTTFRVGPRALALAEAKGGRVVQGRLRAREGPVREVAMRFQAPADALPRQVPYGGKGGPVWGGRFTCWGVDLVLDAQVTGRLARTEGKPEVFRRAPALLTLGSFARIAPLPASA
jgi:hypothetical protein